MILAVVDDLLFLAKIRQTAELVGAPLEVVPASEVETRARAKSVRAIFLDLNLRERPATEILQALKGHPSTSSVPVWGFVSHVQGDLIARARAAGCDTVLARSAFTRQLPKILEKMRGSVVGG
jgi:CheY-like chemotaxis protein